MKIIVLLTIVITLVCILAAGCVGQTNKEPEKCVCPACPSLNTTNTTTVSNVTGTANITKLKGPLIVTIDGFNAVLNVSIDNKTAGVVTIEKPFDQMLDEGNHTVKVCVGVICEQENVVITFGKRTSVDFGERLKRVIEFPTPTARILDYYRRGDGVSVSVEFINPSVKDLSMTADISVGYSYINPRTDQRGADSTRGKAGATVKAGQRVTYIVNLDFADGYSYMFDPPIIGQISAV